MRPSIGSKTTIVTKSYGHKQVFVPSWNAMTVASPETKTYTGKVVRSDPWMKVDEFNLTTGLKHFPIRTISMKHVVSINGMAVAEMKAEKVVTKNVKGSKNNVYVVTYRNDVAEHCTCPGFKYHGGRCKHLSIK